METEINTDENYQRSIIDYMLLPGEAVVRVATISRGIYWKSVVVLVVGLALTLRYGVWLGPFVLAVGAIMLLLAYSTRNYLVLAATDHRLIIRAGIFSQEVIQFRYRQIETVDTLYTPPGMVLGYGSVVITGTGQSAWMVPFVQDAAAFRDDITQKLLETEESLPHPAVTATIPQHASPPP
jgi:hypothetical protein